MYSIILYLLQNLTRSWINTEFHSTSFYSWRRNGFSKHTFCFISMVCSCIICTSARHSVSVQRIKTLAIHSQYLTRVMRVTMGDIIMKLSSIYSGKENLLNWKELLPMGWPLSTLNSTMEKTKVNLQN